MRLLHYVHLLVLTGCLCLGPAVSLAESTDVGDAGDAGPTRDASADVSTDAGADTRSDVMVDAPTDSDARPGVDASSDADATPRTDAGTEADATLDVDDAADGIADAGDADVDAADAMADATSDADISGEDDQGDVVWSVRVQPLSRSATDAVEVVVTLDPESEAGRRVVNTVADAPARFEGVTVGEHDVRVEAIGFETFEDRFRVATQDEVVVQLLPDVPVQVLGTVTTSMGSRPASGTVTLTGVGARAGSASIVVDLDERGAFEMADLAAGFYRVLVDVVRDDGAVETLAVDRFDALADGRIALQTTPRVAEPEVEDLSGCMAASRGTFGQAWIMVAILVGWGRRLRA